MMGIRELRSRLEDKLGTAMSPEQELGYNSTRAKRVLSLERFFVYFIAAFQVYNIFYVLYYTGGQLHTKASRVYMFFYVSLLLVSLGCLLLIHGFRRSFPKDPKKVIYLQRFYGIFMLFWGACITIYDQRVSENISVYMITSLVVATVVNFTPLQAIVTYGAFQTLLFWFLPLFRNSDKDSYGEFVNLFVMTLMCVFISIYLNSYTRKNYLYQQIIVEKNEKLRQIAYQDGLTGLRNRRFLENEMDALYQSCAKEKIPLSFMMLDIDFFKNYNDRYGHLQGDECLRQVSWCIQNTLDPEREYLIRYGGEEFLYIGLGVDAQAAEEKAQHINKIIRKLVIGPSDEDSMGVTISIGVYTVDWDKAAQEPKASWMAWVDEADKALYMAKNSGRDRYVCLHA